MKRFYVATGIASLAVAACGYNNEGYNNQAAYSNEGASYNEGGNYAAEGNYEGSNYTAANSTMTENAATNAAQPANEANSVTNNGY